MRLTQEDYDYLTKSAWVMGTNPSRLVRQLIQMSINAAKTAERERAEKEQQLIDEAKKDFNSESSVVVNAD